MLPGGSHFLGCNTRTSNQSSDGGSTNGSGTWSRPQGGLSACCGVFLVVSFGSTSVQVDCASCENRMHFKELEGALPDV